MSVAEQATAAEATAASSDFVNIARHVPLMAKQHPHGLAVAFPAGRDRQGRVAYTHLTFAQLDRSTRELALGLERMGIGRGCRTVLMVKPSLPFIELTFALFRAGAVPVLVDPGMGVKNLGACLAEAEPEAFVGITKAHVARLVLGWGRPTVKRLVTVGPRLLWGGGTLASLRREGRAALAAARRENPTATASSLGMAQTSADETAAILFTSGSTGVPKGAVYSHRTFATQVELLREVYGIEPGERDLATFPLFGLFGPALGMTTVIPDMDATRPAHVDPDKIFEAIDDHGCTNMFGSPALLDRVSRAGAERGVRLPSLRRVISAGAPVPAVVLERFCRMLDDGVEIHTPYGATESLPIASIGSATILGATRRATETGAGVCVGRPVPRMEVRVIGISDDPIAAWSDDLELPAGAIGEFVVKGPQVSKRYLNRPASNAIAKIADGDDVRHRMGDLGYVGADGLLWFCGRKAHRVRTATGDLFPVPIEQVFNTHPRVYRTALVGVGTRGDERPVLCVELEKGASRAERPRVEADLRALAAERDLTRPVERFLFHPSFPVDIRHNAKIFREKLKVWAAEQGA